MTDLVRIHFELEQDDDGYPPVSVESVWARPTSEGYEIDSIPFFVRCAGPEDVVVTREQEGGLWFDRVVRESSNSLLRVVVFKDGVHESLRSELTSLGCASEWIEQYALVAVHVPSNVSIADVRRVLDAGCEREDWDYEEAILGPVHRA